jgi:Zn-dependent M28 family amino/carboxypeptidase
VTYIGKGKSSLDAIVEAIAAKQGRVVKPDQMPDRGYFYRSDQLSFAKIGVPALYLDNGSTLSVTSPAGARRRCWTTRRTAITSRATRSVPTGTSTA